MSDLIELGSKVSTVDVSPVFDTYSKVIIHISDDTQVVAGNDSGRTLEIDNPFGNQAMADRMLESLQGFQYRPYTANGALLDPAAEIGDALSTETSYGGIYTRSRNFGRLMKADVSAPTDEEIDHEYKYESPTERKFKRTVGEVKASILLTNERIDLEVSERRAQGDSLSSQLALTASAITAEVQRATQAEGNLSASLSVQANEIAAKVSASGGSNSSFGWSLTNNAHTWYSNNQEVMKITASGLIVNGIINAKEGGTIGGFTIGASAIYNNLSKFGGSQTQGVYVGTDGIQLGQGFKVNSSGDVTASSLSLKGNITFLNDDGTSAGTLSAADLRKGAYQAANNYSSWNGTTELCSPGGYIYGGASGFYGGANGSSPPGDFYAGSFHAMQNLEVFGTGNLRCRGNFFLGGAQATWKSIRVVTDVVGGVPEYASLGFVGR